VDPGASVSVSTSPDLEIEGTVHLILLGTEDGGEILGHGRL